MQIHITRLSGLLLCALVSLSAACSSMEVNSKSDAKADFTGYHTYSWKPPTTPAQEHQPSNQLDQAITSSIESELAARGLKRVAPKSPDLWISYVAAAKQAIEQSAGHGPMAGPAYNGFTYSYREGSLTLVMVDAKTNQVVWHGTVSDAVADQGANPPQIAKAVQKLVEKYPTT